MTRPSEKGWFSVLLRSMASWDLWVALVAATAVGVVSTTIEFEPQGEWIGSIIGVSSVALAITLQASHHLQSRLQGSEYGEMLRITDKLETEVRMPYLITMWVSIGSIICSLSTVYVIEEVEAGWAVTALLVLVSFTFVWSCGALIAILRISTMHDRNMARLQATKEEVEAFERLRREVESKRKNAEDHHIEKAE